MRFAYLATYWKLASFFRAVFDDGMHNYKAGIILTLLTLMFVVAATVQVAIHTESPWVFASKPIAIAVALTVAFGSWLLIGSEDSQRLARKRYDNLPESWHTRAAVLTLLLVVSIIVLLAWSLSVGKDVGIINPKPET